MGGYDFDKRERTSRAYVDLTSVGRFPQFGIGETSVEATFGSSGSSFEWTLGANIKIPVIGAGLEYSFLDKELLFTLSARITAWRGGIFRRSDQIRIDYHPWKQQVLLGFAFNSPFKRYRMTRPRKKFVKLPDGKIPPPTHSNRGPIRSALVRIDHSIRWMDKLLTPRFKTGRDFEASASEYKRHIKKPGHTFADEDVAYHREMINAFTIAVGGDEVCGNQLAVAAESVILERVLIPFNRRFGRNKKPYHIAGYANQALREFDDYLNRHSRFELLANDVAESQKATAHEVLRTTLESINTVAERSRKRWKQPHLFWLRQGRLVWLPLNYGLRPEQYDTQDEWNSVLTRVTGGFSTDGNRVKYLLNNQLHVELKRLIGKTDYYQITIIHDFKGRYGPNETDRIGWDVVVDGYIAAFINAIKAVDNGDRKQVPQFMIFIDENFYQDNKSRQIMSYLEELYDVEKPALKNGDIAQQVAAAHVELIKTIRDSPSFGGKPDNELRGIFKVHINVTNPFDPAFWADALIRDHRKIVFRDVFEEDPLSGAAIITGQGVGEHYVGPEWEDRSVLVRGPVLLALKTAARKLFLSQGFREDEVPFYLQARNRPEMNADHHEEEHETDFTTPTLIVMNDTGYGNKQGTVLKAVIYNLLPRDGVLYSMDSLWISDFWAGMFISAALRGAHVFPVGPAAENAPSSAVPTMFLMRETLDMMLQAKAVFREQIQESGGTIRVGLYAHNIPVDDISGRIAAFLEGIEKHSFLRVLFPFHPSVIEILHRSQRMDNGDRSPATSEYKPFLHLKAHFFGTRAALEILGRPEWVPVIEEYVKIRRKQASDAENDGITPAILRVRDTDKSGHNLLTAFDDDLQRLPPDVRDDVILMMMIGSHNQDRRGMLLDGEILLAVFGYDSLISLIDFMFILGTAAWPVDSQEMEEFFPNQGSPGILKKLFKLIQDLI